MDMHSKLSILSQKFKFHFVFKLGSHVNPASQVLGFKACAVTPTICSAGDLYGFVRARQALANELHPQPYSCLSLKQQQQQQKKATDCPLGHGLLVPSHIHICISPSICHVVFT